MSVVFGFKILQAYLLLGTLALVAQTIERCNDVSILLFSAIVWQTIHCFWGDAYNLRRVIEINLFALLEAIYHRLLYLVAPLLGLRIGPEQHWSVGCPYHCQLLRFLRSLRIDERHAWLQSRIAPIVGTKHSAIVANIVDSSLSIPQHGTLNVWLLLGQFKLGRHLIDIGIVKIGSLCCAFYVLTDKQRTL